MAGPSGRPLREQPQVPSAATVARQLVPPDAPEISRWSPGSPLPVTSRGKRASRSPRSSIVGAAGVGAIEGGGDGVSAGAAEGAAFGVLACAGEGLPETSARPTRATASAHRTSPVDPLDRTGGETSDAKRSIPPHSRGSKPRVSNHRPDLRHTVIWVNRPTFPREEARAAVPEQEPDASHLRRRSSHCAGARGRARRRQGRRRSGHDPGDRRRGRDVAGELPLRVHLPRRTDGRTDQCRGGRRGVRLRARAPAGRGRRDHARHRPRRSDELLRGRPRRSRPREGDVRTDAMGAYANPASNRSPGGSTTATSPSQRTRWSPPRNSPARAGAARPPRSPGCW